MTQKKPVGMSWESFVERQIREAQDAGAFDNLPGFGKPLPELDEPDDDLWWVKNLLKREKLSILPPSLEILRTVEIELAAIGRLQHEADMRRAVAKLNEKIRRANYAITWGPPSTVGPLDVEEVVAQWRERKSRQSAIDSRRGCPVMRFSLRTLLLVITVLFLWLGYMADQIHRQRAAVETIERLHGALRYDDALSESPVPHWLADWLGRDAIANVDAVYLGGTAVNDDDLTCLKNLPKLRTLVLTSSPITDAGLLHLCHLTSLETIDLRFTSVTDAGIANLRRVLCDAKILSKSDIE
jgi:hypothetical protein